MSEPKTYSFTDDEQIQLTTLNEHMLLYSHQLRRLVAHFAEKRGIDVIKNQVTFDVEKMIFTVTPEEPVKEALKKTDK